MLTWHFMSNLVTKSPTPQGKSCLDKYGEKDSKMKELKMILANINVNWEFIETW